MGGQHGYRYGALKALESAAGLVYPQLTVSGM